MKIIEIRNEKEVLKALKKGVVSGRLTLVENAYGHKQIIVFVPYNRKPRVRKKDVLIEKLPWGWVRASLKRMKRFTSFPNDLTLEEQLAILDKENELAKEALVKMHLFN